MAQTSVQEMVSRTMAPPYFPVQMDDLSANLSFDGCCESGPFQIGSIRVSPIPLSHPNRGLGYKLEEGGKTFVFLTDNELGYRHEGGLLAPDYVAFCEGADLLLHDAEYTPDEWEQKKTWGHSSYKQAVDLAIEARVGRFGLYHHNHERSDDDVDRFVELCREEVDRSDHTMECFGAAQDSTWYL